MDGTMAVSSIECLSYGGGGIAGILVKAELHLTIVHGPFVVPFGQTQAVRFPIYDTLSRQSNRGGSSSRGYQHSRPEGFF